MLRPSKISECIAKERDHVYRYALELTLDAESADDIAQDVMLHALEQLDWLQLDDLLPQLKQWASELADTQKDSYDTVRLSNVHNSSLNDLSAFDSNLPYTMLVDDAKAAMEGTVPQVLERILWLRFKGHDRSEINNILTENDSVCLGPKRVRYLCQVADKMLVKHFRIAL